MALPKVDIDATAKKSWILMLIIGILMAILGIYSIINGISKNGEGALSLFITIYGLFMVIMGIVDLVESKDMVSSIVMIIIGIVFIVLAWLVTDILVWVLAILLLITGILMATGASKSFMGMNLDKGSRMTNLALGLLLIIAGIITLPVIGIGIDLVMIVVGVLMLITGVGYIVNSIRTQKTSA